MNSLRTFVESYVLAQESLNSAAIAACLAPGEPVLYIAEEIEQPLVGSAQIAAYWDENQRTFHRMKLRIGPISARAVASGIALAHYHLHWDVALRSAQPPGWQTPIGGDVIASLVAREQQGHWCILHYTETTLGALPLVRRAYERAVDPSFAAELEAEAARR